MDIRKSTPFKARATFHVSPFHRIFVLHTKKANGKLLHFSHGFCFMYTEQIRKIGDQPLRDIIKKLGGWPVLEPNWKPPNISIEKLMGTLRGEYSEPVLLEIYVGADDKNSSINILQVRDWKSRRPSRRTCSIYFHIFSPSFSQIDQLVLALPSRDYYLKASSEGDLKAYHRYMTQTAVLLGANAENAFKELDHVVKFEMKLANVSKI